MADQLLQPPDRTIQTAASASQVILSRRLDGDVYDRFQLLADGSIFRGDGATDLAEVSEFSSNLFAWRHFR